MFWHVTTQKVVHFLAGCLKKILQFEFSTF